jgi:hypothetical protein
MSSPWPYQNSVPLTDVLRAGTWENHTTFTNFYLGATIKDDFLSLGTLAVLQQVVLTCLDKVAVCMKVSIHMRQFVLLLCMDDPKTI